MDYFHELPEPLALKVLYEVIQVSASYPETLLSLACSNKWFASKLSQPSADVLWSRAWSVAKLKRPAAAAEEQKINLAMTVMPRDKLRLAGFVGCMLCGAKSIRKVYWEFNVRCCKDCLIKHSVAEYYLKEEYSLDPKSFQHLPSRQVELYHPRKGAFTMRTYWKDHLLPVLREERNVQSFEEFVEQKKAEKQQEMDRKNQEGQVKDAKRTERREQLQEWWKEDGVNLDIAGKCSQTYKRNCNLAMPLKRKAYNRLVPIIKTEIEEEKRQILHRQLLQEQAVEAERLKEQRRTENKRKSDEQWSMARQQKRSKESCMPGPRVTCSVCGSSRLFSANGLRDHTNEKHPNSTPSALLEYNLPNLPGGHI
ncbi:hypothetical protein ABBQ32_007264 [Trebouxia sp. C0010 RCD-2024]